MKQKYCCLLFAVLLLFSCRKLELNRINKITTDEVTVTNTAVSAGGTIIDIGKKGITKYGHCWSVNATPTVNDAKTEFTNASAGLEFTSTLTHIAVNTAYYIRAYAVNAEETVYGEVKTVAVSSFAAVTVAASNVQIQNETAASVTGNIANLGALTAIEYGHCWATHTAPVITDYKTNYGGLSSDINFGSALANLTMESTYYIRAYLRLNNTTVIYSNELSVVIHDLAVTTDNHSIAGTTASLQGTIVSLGVLPVTDHGHCWSSVTSSPNFNDNVISQGPATITGQYYSNLSGLVSGTTYYFRAYARKGNTIKYGIVKSFIF